MYSEDDLKRAQWDAIQKERVSFLRGLGGMTLWTIVALFIYGMIHS